MNFRNDSMDSRLRESLRRWQNHIDALKKIEEKFFILEASEKPTYSLLFLRSDGKNISEREANVYVHEDWQTFSEGLKRAHADYLHHKRTLEIRAKEFDAEYLSVKLEGQNIERNF